MARIRALLVARAYFAYTIRIDVGRKAGSSVPKRRPQRALVPKSTVPDCRMSSNSMLGVHWAFSTIVLVSMCPQCGLIPRKTNQLMRLFIFKSERSRDLRAFSDEPGGGKLPEQFRPWHAVGVVRADSVPPHNLKRDVIEAAIASAGYQLWKLKSEK